MQAAHGTSQPTSIIGVIPARWASTRFPGKPLFEIAGRPLVQHVWDQCQKCKQLDGVVIATDDERIAQAAGAFGAEVIMTSPNHPTGTDRIGEVLEQLPKATHAINIQGDEPLIDPNLIDRLASELHADTDLEMVTAASQISEAEEIADPNVVKVVLSEFSDALYFSRSAIPFQRNAPDDLVVYRHVGLYAYRRDFVRKFLSWAPTAIERAESLEQLRALSHGTRIRVVLTDHVAPGVDTPEQAAAIESILSQSPS